MAERYWTRAEVEALIPALSEIVETVVAAQREVEGLREWRKEEERRIAASGGGVPDRATWRANSARADALASQIRAALDRVVALGGVPKDLTLGLVDVPHLRDGRVVNLCWKYGERDVRYWHGLDEGYAARKPLEGGGG